MLLVGLFQRLYLPSQPRAVMSGNIRSLKNRCFLMRFLLLPEFSLKDRLCVAGGEEEGKEERHLHKKGRRFVSGRSGADSSKESHVLNCLAYARFS